MYAAYPRPPVRRPIGANHGRTPLDAAWKLTWPFIISLILAIVMLIVTIVIIALEIASLANSTSSIYGNTASTGAGIWCGIFFLIAAVLILIMNWMRKTRLWATIALIASIVAACFAVILLGLDAKAVQDARDTYIDNIFGYTRLSTYTKPKILAAQLAFAVIEFLLCLAYIGIYVAVLILAPRRLRRPPPRFA